ncbi:hypothetical protein FIBSPDRAFT_901580 [Athelia psychrophila]|uniref:Uncharacterized protein n=1 Tax=Athelia psychrophila TaxID=1759441 RepID=A0A165WZS8_9AGAM|nr:hypothetical protein FIBSPDRAFT_901580 [Fibularhizoctonia sp. CBS 109695]
MLDLDDALWRIQLLDRVKLNVTSVPQFCLDIKDIADWAWYCLHVDKEPPYRCHALAIIEPCTACVTLCASALAILRPAPLFQKPLFCLDFYFNQSWGVLACQYYELCAPARVKFMFQSEDEYPLESHPSEMLDWSIDIPGLRSRRHRVLRAKGERPLDLPTLYTLYPMATTFNTLGIQDCARVNNANEIHIYNGPVYIYNIACNHVCNHVCNHSPIPQADSDGASSAVDNTTSLLASDAQAVSAAEISVIVEPVETVNNGAQDVQISLHSPALTRKSDAFRRAWYHRVAREFGWPFAAALGPFRGIPTIDRCSGWGWAGPLTILYESNRRRHKVLTGSPLDPNQRTGTATTVFASPTKILGGGKLPQLEQIYSC